jgi:N-acylneuraminate cytidylyltransferase
MRPAALAQDESPMLPVLRHALAEVEHGGDRYDLLLLLDPTSPGRLPEDVRRAHELLAQEPAADGVVAVSEPGYNLLWHAVVDRGGFIEPLIPGAERYARRQDVPRVFRINAALYLFRTQFLRREQRSWLNGRHLVLEIPEERAFHIDSEHDFRLCELALESGLVRLPWIQPD